MAKKTLWKRDFADKQCLGPVCLWWRLLDEMKLFNNFYTIPNLYLTIYILYIIYMPEYGYDVGWFQKSWHLSFSQEFGPFPDIW